MYLVLENQLIQKLKIILNSNTFFIVLVIMIIINILYRVNNLPKQISDSNEIIGIITSIKNNENNVEYIIKNKYNYIINYSKENKFNLGDKIKVKGSFDYLKENSVFNAFNYKKYCLSKNIFYSIKSNNIVLIKKNKNIFYMFKTYLIKRISKIKKAEYLKTFILGDSSDISDNIMSIYRQNGISHLFSVSGMHVGLLSSIILFLLKKIKKSNVNYIFVSLFLILFLFLTDFTPSVVRAVLLFLFLLINKFLKLNISTLKIFLLVLILVLNINPYIIYNIGFQFSYTVTFFLIVFNKIINNFNNYISKVLITSFISFISSIPIMINNYSSINIITILNNVIFVPMVSIIIFPFSLIVLIIPKIDFIYNVLINVLEIISSVTYRFKIEIVLCKIPFAFLILYYIVIIFILNNIKKKNYKPLLIIIIILIIHTNINYFSSNSFITFIDVGQGDSSLLHFSHNKGNVLIDTGGRYGSNISNSIINYLKSIGIKKLSYLVITHGDYDHMGEAINLVNNFKVEKVIFNCGAYNDLEQELIKVLDKKKIKYYSCIKELNIDKNKLYFLQTKEYDNENDNSNVIYTELNGYKFMFMGDASSTTEYEILKEYNLPDIDVLKAGHHGSKTSSSETFINEIKPKYSIISVGKNNRYGHPNKEVLNNLEDSKIYRTDQDGSIMFKIKKNKLKIKTCIP